MNSIYMILLAMYLFNLAFRIDNKLEKADWYKGILMFASLVCFLTSIFIHICEAI